jgi:uncharacterized membrane protein (DUF373 family)
VTSSPAQHVQNRPWLIRKLGVVLSGFESLLYGVVGLLLMVAAAFVVFGTVTATTTALADGKDASEIGIIVLDRILLALIVAELIYSLRLVMQTHQISTEPFLFIGLIATLRRILIVTADSERPEAGPHLTGLLIELGVLGFLVVGLAAAIFLVRLSERHREPQPG